MCPVDSCKKQFEVSVDVDVSGNGQVDTDCPGCKASLHVVVKNNAVTSVTVNS